MGEPGGGVGGPEVIRIFLPLSNRLENYEYEYIQGVPRNMTVGE